MLKCLNRYKCQKILVFILTFLIYLGLHSMREGWSYSKTQLKNQFGITSPQFGLVDTLYLLFYAIGMGTIGNLSSKINLKYFVSVGMLISSIFYMSFSFLFLLTHKFYYPYVVVAMAINAFFQSTGWPGIVGIIGNWFGKGRRGFLMGVWALNANAGNIVALVMCNILDKQYHVYWTANFLTTGFLALGISLVCLVILKQKPQIDQQEIASSDFSSQNRESLQSRKEATSILTQNEMKTQQTQQKQRQVNVFTAIFLPRVPLYVVSYSCMKACIYGLIFWLPFYLSHVGMQNQSGYIASMVDVGSFIGGMIIGYLGDYFSFRALFLSPGFFISAILMFIVAFADIQQSWIYYVALFFIGIMAGGPYNIIGTAITIDIGEEVGKKNTAKISALIQGSAAFFAALSQILISYIPKSSIFYLFCAECLISAFALLPLFIKDYKQLKKSKEQNRVNLI